MAERDIGVPGAVAEALKRLRERVLPEQLDRIWIFPPLSDGRSESGVVAAGCFAGADRRILVTLSYRAEETGRGVTFHPRFQEEGEAPTDRLPRVMEGVVERSGVGFGPPRSTSLKGDPEALETLIREWTPMDEPDRAGSTATGVGRFGSSEETLG